MFQHPAPFLSIHAAGVKPVGALKTGSPARTDVAWNKLRHLVEVQLAPSELRNHLAADEL